MRRESGPKFRGGDKGEKRWQEGYQVLKRALRRKHHTERSELGRDPQKGCKLGGGGITGVREETEVKQARGEFYLGTVLP